MFYTILYVLTIICVILAVIAIGLNMIGISNRKKDTEGVENTLDLYNSNISKNNYEKEWKHGDFS